MDKLIPGTDKKFENENAFESFLKTIELTNGLSLGQVCSITGNDPFVIQNWVKRGYVSRPINKKYHEKQLARILMINALKDSMKIDEIGKLMELVNGDVEDESDDLLSEVELYTLLSKVVYKLEKDSDIEEVIKKEIKSQNMDNDKLFIALEVMTNGYIASTHKKEANKYLSILETF